MQTNSQERSVLGRCREEWEREVSGAVSFQSRVEEVRTGRYADNTFFVRTVRMEPSMRISGILSALTAIMVANVSVAQNVDHKWIAGGSVKWVSSSGDKSPTDAMINIGSMRQNGDALEVIIRWPYMPASYGPEAVEKDHIICRANGALSFSVEEGPFRRMDIICSRMSAILQVGEKRLKSGLYKWRRSATEPRSTGQIRAALPVGQLLANALTKLSPGLRRRTERRSSTPKKLAK